MIALQQEDVAAVMTPRTDMDCVEAQLSLDEARRRMIEAGHSRMPVIGNSTDDIVGILYAKDLLRHLSDGAESSQPVLKDIVREPFYVPETTGIDKLLESMKRRRVHIAIVLDEYGGVAGLVTMEDVLEQIVGEIRTNTTRPRIRASARPPPAASKWNPGCESTISTNNSASNFPTMKTTTRSADLCTRNWAVSQKNATFSIGINCG